MEDNALIETRQQGVQIALPYFKRLNKLASFVSTIELTVTKKTVTTLSLLTMITSLQTITKSCELLRVPQNSHAFLNNLKNS